MAVMKWLHILFRSRAWLSKRYCATGEHVHIWARYGLTQMQGMPVAQSMWFSHCSICQHGAIHNEPAPSGSKRWKLLPFPADVPGPMNARR